MSGCSGLLLDLGILTRLRGSHQDPEVARFLQLRRHQRIFISALTLCELADAGSGDAANPEAWLRELTERFAANILPVDHGTALACRSRGPGESVPGDAGKLRSPAVLAATARQHRLTVVSSVPLHYAGLDVRVLDPLAASDPAASDPAASPSADAT